MTTAIFGLIGVLVGGVLNGVVTAAIEARRDARALQAATRLLSIDVAGAKTTYEDCLQSGTWSSYPSRPLPLEQWEEWKNLLASRLGSSSDWRKLTAPFLDMRHNNELAARHKDNDQMVQPSQEGMQKAVARIDEAIPLLTHYVRGDHLRWNKIKATFRR